MRIAALTCRSFYSLLRGAVSVRRWVEKAGACGYGAVALADVNCMAGVVDLCQAAEKADLRPIVGVEILTENQRAILLAENERGYANLCGLPQREIWRHASIWSSNCSWIAGGFSAFVRKPDY